MGMTGGSGEGTMGTQPRGEQSMFEKPDWTKAAVAYGLVILEDLHSLLDAAYENAQDKVVEGHLGRGRLAVEAAVILMDTEPEQVAEAGIVRHDIVIRLNSALEDYGLEVVEAKPEKPRPGSN